MGYAAAAFLQARLLSESSFSEASIEADLRAAKLGHPMSQLIVGISYDAGNHGLAQDRDQALYWLERSRDNGNVDAVAVLAAQHLFAGSAEHDPDLALELLENAVAAGSKLARVHLARAHLEAPKGDKAFGEELMMEQMRRGDTSALIVYTTFIRDALETGNRELARRLYCTYDAVMYNGLGHELFETYFDEPLICKES